jgi:hypothetical protein
MSWYFDREQRYIHVQNNLMAYQCLCGAGSGAIAKTAVAPLERVKILLQLQGMKSTLSNLPQSTSMVALIRYIIREEGVVGLFKGNGANVVRVIPVYALKFSFNDTFKNLIRAPGQNNRQLTLNQLMLAGTMAGLFQITITYPLELVRTRLALSTADSHYKGIIDCAVKTVKTEGIGALYKGITATWWSGAPYVGLQMTTYEMIKRHLPSIFLVEVGNKHNPNLPPRQDINITGKLVSGALSGLISQTLTFPGDTIRRRMQTNGLNGKPRQYSSTWDCIRQTYTKEGMIGFMRGASTNVWRCIPGAALQFAMYDSFKSIFGIAVD